MKLNLRKYAGTLLLCCLSSIVLSANVLAPPPPPSLVGGNNGLINNKRPHIVGTAGAKNIITVYVDNTIAGSVVTDVNGNYTFTLPFMAEGPHKITADCTDPGNNTSAPSDPLNITIDTQAPASPSQPTVPGSVLDGNLVFSNNTTPTLNGTAEIGSALTIFLNGQQTGTTMTDLNGNYSFTFSSSLNNGSHGISISATDAAGNVSYYSNQLNLIIDTYAPTAERPVLTSTNVNGVTADITPDISGNAYEPSLTVTLYTDGVIIGTTTTDANGRYTFSSPSGLSDGPHAITVTATDKVGNTSILSPALNFTVDATPPVAPPAPVLVNGVNGRTSNATPDITGTAEANSLVRIFADNVFAGTSNATANGDYSFTFTGYLSDGTHAITALAIDKVGNQGIAGAALTITIDTQAPAPPSQPTVPGSLIDGLLTLSNNRTPTLNGTAEANSAIKVLASGQLAGTTTTDATGHYSFTFANALSDGSYGISLNATDAVGNTSFYSNQLNLIVDTQAPYVELPVLTSTNNNGSTADVTPDIKGTTYESRVIITVYADGVKMGTTTTDANGDYVYSITSNLPDGPHAITVTGTDILNNISAISAPLNIIIDTRPPVAPTTPVLENGVNGQTNSATPLITGNAEANSVVTIYADNANVGTTTADNNGNYSFRFPVNLNDGPRAITVTATDAAGNTSIASATLTITIDTQPPAPPSQPTVPGSLIDGLYTLSNNRTPTLNGTAEANSVIKVLASGQLAGTTTTDATGHYLFTFASALRDGSYGISLNATDAVGNTSAYSNQLNLIIDTQAPYAELPVLTSTNDNGLTADVTPDIKGTTYESRVVINVYVDGVKMGTTNTAANGDYVYSITSSLPDGPHAITVTGTDILNNTGAPSAALNITIDATPPVAPSAPALANGVNGQTNDNTPDITGSAEANSVVTIYIDNINVGTATVAENGNYSFTIPSALSDGPHTMKVTATDKAGNTSVPGAVLNFIVDTKAPDAPALVLQTSSNNGVIGTATPVITGTAEANSNVAVYADGVKAGTTNADTNGNYTYTINLSEGTHTITTNATDVAGNSSVFSNTISFRVDLTAPTATLSIPANSGNNSKPVTVTITFSEAVTGFNAAGLNVTGGEATGFISVSPIVYTMVIAPLTSTTATVTVAAGAAVDSAGNSSQASNIITLKPATTSSISMAYPMPATDRINVRFEGVNNGTGIVSMTSLSGQVMLKEPATINSGLMTVNVQRLPAGTYVLVVFVKETNMTYNRTVLIAR